MEAVDYSHCPRCHTPTEEYELKDPQGRVTKLPSCPTCKLIFHRYGSIKIPSGEEMLDKDLKDARMDNPFPMKLASGEEVLDELCECGHRRTEHHPSVVQFGHGECKMPRCQCYKFTWVGFITKDGVTV